MWRTVPVGLIGSREAHERKARCFAAGAAQHPGGPAASRAKKNRAPEWSTGEKVLDGSKGTWLASSPFSMFSFRQHLWQLGSAAVQRRPPQGFGGIHHRITVQRSGVVRQVDERLSKSSQVQAAGEALIRARSALNWVQAGVLNARLCPRHRTTVVRATADAGCGLVVWIADRFMRTLVE